METMYTTNMQILNQASNKALELVKKLYDLEYFDKTNYEKNIKDFKFEIVNENESKIFQDNQFVKYDSKTNSIYVRGSIINQGNIDEETMSMLILHELIHMASCNRETNMSGFDNSYIVPITYNEGCTQYLTIKLMYPDRFEEAINNNTFYPESVKTVKRCVDAIGEETVFNHYFEADLKKEVDEFSPKVLDKWIDYVMALDQSLEERISRSYIENDKEEDYGESLVA